MDPQNQNELQQLGELLSAYLDDELSPNDTKKAEKLLGENPQARELLAELRQISSRFSELPRLEAPQGLAQQIQLQLERQMLIGNDDERAELAGRNHLRRRRLAAAAAIFILAGAVVAIVYNVLFQPVKPAETDQPIITAHQQPIIERPATTEESVPLVAARKSVLPEAAQEQAVEPEQPPAYSSVRLTLKADDASVAETLLENIITGRQIKSAVHTAGDEKRGRFDFLCDAEQLRGIVGQLRDIPGGQTELIVDENNRGGASRVVISDPTVEQVLALAGESEAAVRFGLALNFSRPSAVTGPGEGDSRPLAQSEPQINGLRLLGPDHLESIPPKDSQSPTVAHEAAPTAARQERPAAIERAASMGRGALIAVTLTVETKTPF